MARPGVRPPTRRATARARALRLQQGASAARGARPRAGSLAPPDITVLEASHSLRRARRRPDRHVAVAVPSRPAPCAPRVCIARGVAPSHCHAPRSVDISAAPGRPLARERCVRPVHTAQGASRRHRPAPALRGASVTLARARPSALIAARGTSARGVPRARPRARALRGFTALRRVPAPRASRAPSADTALAVAPRPPHAGARGLV